MKQPPRASGGSPQLKWLMTELESLLPTGTCAQAVTVSLKDPARSSARSPSFTPVEVAGSA